MSAPTSKALLTLLLLSGCAESVGDIDRTQPNYVRKADLDGTWHYLQTVVGVPPTSTFTFVGETSRTEKIRWSFQEDVLVGYRSYPMIPGAERPDTAPPDLYGDEYTENPVVAFAIDSHFDRIRGYNETTGEQTNVLEENEEDRPWFAREYARVDWSKNLVSNFDFVSEASEVTNLEYFVQEEQGGEDALYRETDARDRTVYFDLVGKMFVEPDWRGCVYTWMGWAAEDCTAGEIKVRSSLSLAPEEPDYEPFQYDDNLMSKFGYFRSERATHDPRRGQTDEGRRYMINRHGIWAATYQRDPDTGGFLRDDRGRRLPIPISERETRAVPYYLSEAFPDDPLLLWAAFDTVEQWNEAARQGVAALQGRPLEEVGPVFVGCHNPVRHGDPEACGEPGFVARFGDLRRSVLHWVDADQLEGPLGYGPSVVDPVTGETLAGKAHVYGAAVDTYASYAMDIIRLLNEELPAADLATGEHFRAEVRQRLAGTIDPEQLHSGLQGVPVRDLRDELARGRRPADDAHPEAHRRYERLARREQRRAEGFAPWSRQAAQSQYERLLEAGVAQRFVDNDEVRALVAGRAQQAGAGALSLDDLPGDLLDPGQLGRELSPFALKRRHRMFKRALARNIASPDFLETSALGLARAYEGRTDYDRMWRELRALVFRATALHEVGHTVGLRHNFNGSYDALNFFDEYWDLRGQTLPDPDCNCFSKCRRVDCEEGGVCNKLTGECIGAPGARCEGVVCREGWVCDGNTGRCVSVRQEEPSYADLYRMASHTEEQIDGRMQDHQYSSIMDYGYSFQSDLVGLGKYDAAAMAFGYGCGADRVPDDDPRCEAPDALTDSGGCLVQRPGPVPVFAKRQGELGRAGELLSGSETHFGHTVRYDDTNIPNVNVLERYHYSTVAQAFPERADLLDREWMRYDDFVARVSDAKAPRADRPVRVPFSFCSDEWVEEMLSCQLFDQGADPFEMTRTKANHWRAFYYFDNFRRNRFGWEAWHVLSRSFSRYFLPLSDYHQFWWFAEDGYDPVFDAYFEMAAYTGFNLLAEVLSVPPYGTYCRSRQDGSLIPLSDDTTRQDRRAADEQVPGRAKAYCASGEDLVEVLQGDGRRRLSRFAFDTGYYSYDRTLEAGHWWSTMAAVWALTDPDASVIGVDAESGTYSISFYDLFDDEFSKLAAGIVMEDHRLYAPRYLLTGDADGDGVPDGEVLYRPPARLWAQDARGSWLRVDPENGRMLPSNPDADRALCQTCDSHSDCRGFSGFYGGVFCVAPDVREDPVCLQDCQAFLDCDDACRDFERCQQRCRRWARSCDGPGGCDDALDSSDCDAKGGCRADLDPGTCGPDGNCDERLDPCGPGETCSDGGNCVPRSGCRVRPCSEGAPDGGCPEGEACRGGACLPAPVVAQTDPTLMLVDNVLLWGLYDLREGYELRFNDGFRVFRMGTDEEETPDGRDFEVITFTDPIGGHEYGAIQPRCDSADPNARCRHLRIEPTPAERMVRRGQELSTAYLDALDAYYAYDGDDEALDDQLRWDYYGAEWRLGGFMTNLGLLRSYQSWFEFLF